MGRLVLVGRASARAGSLVVVVVVVVLRAEIGGYVTA
jgi:hypothetical protein